MYAIAVYMWQMAQADTDQHSIGHIDNAHKNLIVLINRMLSEGIAVNVVDFNWDCVLESVWDLRRSAHRFGWNCGRERVVIADDADGTPLSTLVARKCFQPPPADDVKCSRWAGLIKPHGDWCTFLQGPTGVFYRGGRHSHTHSATFAPKLADISADDRFVRTSVLPPTNSRFRHGSQFYEDEKHRLISALTDSDTVVIIGWSARGPDNFYREIFRSAFASNSSGPNLLPGAENV